LCRGFVGCPSLCLRCVRLRVLRAARSLSTLRLCMTPICSPFSHCCSCSLAATRPALPCCEAVRRPRFPPRIAGLRSNWGAGTSHMQGPCMRTRVPQTRCVRTSPPARGGGGGAALCATLRAQPPQLAAGAQARPPLGCLRNAVFFTHFYL
jgi:hypothetical protein